MFCSIQIKYDDGRREHVQGSQRGLSEITIAAIQLADDIGKSSHIEGRERPRWLRISCNGKLYIGIIILNGGLPESQGALLSLPM